MGRPTKYDKKYADELRAYFDIEAGVDVEVENSKGIMQSVRHAADLPTLAGFACKINVHRATLLRWAEAHPEFCDALKMAKEHQERILVQNALKSGYHPTFAIFTAKNLIDWRDKQEHELSGPNGGPLEYKSLRDDELDARIRMLEAQIESGKKSG